MARKAPTMADVFLRVIVDLPDDDAPRLIYSDWLDDHGDPDRAEFIRLQCRLAALAEDDPERAALVRREKELEREHGERWLAEVQPIAGVTFSGFERGFISQARINLSRWRKPDRARRTTALFAAGPIREITLDDASPATVAALLGDPAALRLRALNFFDMTRPVEVVRTIAESLHVRNLAQLDFFDADLDDVALVLLASSPHLANLTQFYAVNCGPFTPEGVRALAESPHLTRLTHLYLPLGETAPDSYAVLATAPNLASLRELSLNGYVGVEGLAHLARSQYLTGLLSLQLQGTSLGDAGMQVLAGAPWRSMQKLDLSRNGLGDGGMRALAEWPGLASVEVLKLLHNSIGPEGLAALVASPHLGRLGKIDLSNNPIGREGVTAIVAASLPRLRDLDLWRCQIGDAGAHLIAGSPASSRLTKLTLSYNDLTDAGAQALLESPHLGAITRLEVLGNPFSDPVKEALVRRFGDVWL